MIFKIWHLFKSFFLKGLLPLKYCDNLCLVNLEIGPLAQSVEQRTFNPWVVGSIPTGPTILLVWDTFSPISNSDPV